MSSQSLQLGCAQYVHRTARMPEMRVRGEIQEVTRMLGLPRWSSSSDSVLPLQGTWVQPLVREVTSHTLFHGQKE